MTISEMNAKLASDKKVQICPWNDAWSNQCLVDVVSVAPGRSVTYSWLAGDGETLVEKTAQVCFSTWAQIVEALA